MIVNDVPERESVCLVNIDYLVDAIKEELPVAELENGGYDPDDYGGFFVERNCWFDLWNVWGFHGFVPDLHKFCVPILIRGEISEYFGGPGRGQDD